MTIIECDIFDDISNVKGSEEEVELENIKLLLVDKINFFLSFVETE